MYRRSCGFLFSFHYRVPISRLYHRFIYSREASGGMIVGIGSCEDGRLIGTVYDFLYDGYVLSHGCFSGIALLSAIYFIVLDEISVID